MCRLAGAGGFLSRVTALGSEVLTLVSIERNGSGAEGLKRFHVDAGVIIPLIQDKEADRYALYFNCNS